MHACGSTINLFLMSNIKKIGTRCVNVGSLHSLLINRYCQILNLLKDSLSKLDTVEILYTHLITKQLLRAFFNKHKQI
jgi:hypothetical protein